MLRKELAADRLERHVGALIGVSCVARVAAPITPRVSVLRRGARGGAHNPTRRYGRHNPTLLTQVIPDLSDRFRTLLSLSHFTSLMSHFTSPLATLSQHVHSRHMLAHASCGCATRVTAMRTGRHTERRDTGPLWPDRRRRHHEITMRAPTARHTHAPLSDKHAMHVARGEWRWRRENGIDGAIPLAPGALPHAQTRRICNFLSKQMATQSGCPLDHCSWFTSDSA